MNDEISEFTEEQWNYIKNDNPKYSWCFCMLSCSWYDDKNPIVKCTKYGDKIGFRANKPERCLKCRHDTNNK